MKTTPPLFAEERKEQILKLLQETSKILVPQLCETFEVSPATIRNDLRDLESEGKIRRTHGGAISVDKAMFEPKSSVKEVAHIEEKRQIAACAAQFVEDGDTIALDTGTTTMELAKCLVEKKGLTIVLYDIKIAEYLENHTDANIVMVGGSLRRGFHCVTGPMTVSMLSTLNVDKVFMASNAFSPQKGFTTPDIGQAEVKRVLIHMAQERIMLLDSSKIGKITFTNFAQINDINKLITDGNAGKKAAAVLERIEDSVEVHIA